LPIDNDGDPLQGTYSYPSGIGMLGYIGHTRPDTGFSTSRCARFTRDTRHSHEKALERIGQNLKLTQDKGLILRPALCDESGELPIDCYVDADFAGLWGYEDRNDTSCVKSRTGCVLTSFHSRMIQQVSEPADLPNLAFFSRYCWTIEYVV
jgi:hypothetical protein